MAIISHSMANIHLAIAEIASRYDGNYAPLWRILFRYGENSLESCLEWQELSLLGDGRFPGHGSCLAPLKLSRIARAIVKRKSSQPDSREGFATQLGRQVPVQWLDYRLDKFEQLPGFLLRDLAVDGSGYRLPARPIVATQENRKQFRSQKGDHSVAWAAGASAGAVGGLSVCYFANDPMDQ